MAKPASQCVHRAERDASHSCTYAPPSVWQRSLARGSALSDQPSGNACMLLTFPITPAEQGGPVWEHGSSSRMDGTHTFSLAHICTKHQLVHQFGWICVRDRMQQRLLVISTSICHGLPQVSPTLQLHPLCHSVFLTIVNVSEPCSRNEINLKLFSFQTPMASVSVEDLSSTWAVHFLVFFSETSSVFH